MKGAGNRFDSQCRFIARAAREQSCGQIAPAKRTEARQRRRAAAVACPKNYNAIVFSRPFMARDAVLGKRPGDGNAIIDFQEPIMIVNGP